METAKVVADGTYRVITPGSVKSYRVLQRARTAARGSQFIDYGFGILYLLLSIRMALSMVAAETTSGFVHFIRAVTNPFFAPFRDIVPGPTAEGGYLLGVPIVIAIVAYAILHGAINAMLRMAVRKTVI